MSNENASVLQTVWNIRATIQIRVYAYNRTQPGFGTGSVSTVNVPSGLQRKCIALHCEVDIIFMEFNRSEMLS